MTGKQKGRNGCKNTNREFKYLAAFLRQKTSSFMKDEISLNMGHQSKYFMTKMMIRSNMMSNQLEELLSTNDSSELIVDPILEPN